MQKLTRERQLETLLVICLGLTVVFFISKNNVVLLTSFAVGIVGLASGKAAYWISFLWLKLGELLGAVSSKIILSAIYFLVLVPVALLSKIGKRTNSFTLKKGTSDSYYYTRNHRYTAKDLENPW